MTEPEWYRIKNCYKNCKPV